MSNLIELIDVSMCYKRKRLFGSSVLTKWVLDDISLVVREGECLGVVGRNGAGKSSLLRLLAGIVEPDRGVVRHRGQASLLTLQAGFIESLSGRENVVLGGMMLGASKKDMKEKMEEIVGFSELGTEIDNPLYTYSTGMRARLGFSVAYFCDPEIILIDEVLGVGDAEFSKKSSAAMREKIRSNRTIVLVSHNQDTILRNCNRAVLIENGRLVGEGAPKDVLSAM